MYAILISSLFLFSTFTLGSIQYTGLSYSVKHDFLENKYKEIYKKLGNDIKLNLPDITYNILSIFGIKFTASKIILKNKVLNAAFKSFNFIDKTLEIENFPDFFNGNISFDYSLIIFGMKLFYGVAVVNIKSKSAKFVQDFNKPRITSSFKVDCISTFQSITGIGFFGVIKNLITKVVNNAYASMAFNGTSEYLNIGTSKIYKKIIFQSLNDKKFNLTLMSRVDNIISNEITGYVHFLFDTTVTVPYRPYNTSTTVKIESNPDKEGNQTLCYSGHLLALMYDTFGKGRNFMMKITPEASGIGNQVSSLTSILPRVGELADLGDKLAIGCRTNSSNKIEYLNISNTGRLKVPVVCFFDSKRTGRSLLEFDFNINKDFNKTFVDSNGILNMDLNGAELKSFSYEKMYSKVENEMAIQQIILSMVPQVAENITTLAFKINPNITDSEQEIKKFGNEICFTYT